MTASAHTHPTAESLDSKSATTDYQPPISAPSISTLMPKTVDYGHGHGMDNMQTFNCVIKTLLMASLNFLEPGATVERISYGERIILRPDPVSMDRGYEKGMFHWF